MNRSLNTLHAPETDRKKTSLEEVREQFDRAATRVERVAHACRQRGWV